MVESGFPHVASDEFVAFWESGASATGEFRCSECGHVVTVSHVLPRCATCGGESWQQTEWHPFTRRQETTFPA
jgi:hypothetical protein